MRQSAVHTMGGFGELALTFSALCQRLRPDVVAPKWRLEVLAIAARSDTNQREPGRRWRRRGCGWRWRWSGGSWCVGAGTLDVARSPPNTESCELCGDGDARARRCYAATTSAGTTTTTGTGTGAKASTDRSHDLPDWTAECSISATICTMWNCSYCTTLMNEPTEHRANHQHDKDPASVIPRRHRSNGLAAAVVEGSGPRPGTFVLAVVAVAASLVHSCHFC
jgi:hypothetical protein